MISSARSRSKTHFTFYGFPCGPINETRHGESLGAYIKMIQRVSVRVTGNPTDLGTRYDDPSNSKVLFFNMTSREQWEVEVTKPQRLMDSPPGADQIST
jgi:hypothetical protein